ncbi:23S rRNA (pseudouridine(1915)-N(3))-methyltransferase RlmH [Thermosulfurimonas marina]|nr:23S rRNA (pseudouridine(1915)-N(3))-methyltransferase RlmH [Thermosulfurimonas marina]
MYRRDLGKELFFFRHADYLYTMRFPVRLLLLAPGPLHFPFIKEGLDYYTRRLKAYLRFETRFPRLKSKRPAEEARRLLAHLPKGAYLLALDERGRSLRTPEMAAWLEDLFFRHREMAVVCGGPEGLPPEILEAAEERLSLSPLTLNHELALLVFAEALYRALTLLSGHPYHREGVSA